MAYHESSGMGWWPAIMIFAVMFAGNGWWVELLVAGIVFFSLSDLWRAVFLPFLVAYWWIRTLNQPYKPPYSATNPVLSIPGATRDRSYWLIRKHKKPSKPPYSATNPVLSIPGATWDRSSSIESDVPSASPRPQIKPAVQPSINVVVTPSIVPGKAVDETQQTQHEPFVTVRLGFRETTHRIPPPPPSIRDAIQTRWIPPGESVKVAGFSLPGGMLYVGSPADRTRREDPSLIDPALAVTSHPIDPAQKLTSYLPDYAQLTPDARRAYLQWLAGGRREREIDIGYLFLFYYGLEHRVLIDARDDLGAQAEIPLIVQEIQRLLVIYGSNHSFRNYATELLEYLESMTIGPAIYSAPFPDAWHSMPLPMRLLIGQGPLAVDRQPLPASWALAWQLPIRLRIGLGQLAVDRQPLPASWALAWVLSDPNRVLRTPVKRCVDYFATLFQVKYTEWFGLGMRLHANKTRLTISYRAASDKLTGREFKRELDKLPEIAAQSAPQAKLQELINACASLLDPYSRFIARHPELDKSHESCLLLPLPCWPAELTAALAKIQEQTQNEMQVTRFGALMERLHCGPTLPRETASALATALAAYRIGMEPDFEGGGKRFKPDDVVVLFHVG
ncbi:MAG: TerB N-terminal domain-containing protein, partial [Magnetococcales bacterium]|nr:TerB N-terminal domain-containing protein [Magnetococcales bacterium]